MSTQEHTEYQQFLREKARRGLRDDVAAWTPFRAALRAALPLVPWLREHLNPGDLVLDARNRTGWTGGWLAGLLPGARVISTWRGDTDALGTRGFDWWLPGEVALHDPETAWSLPAPARLVVGFDLLHNHDPARLLSALVDASAADAVWVFPHVHLAESEPPAGLVRQGTLRTAAEWRALLTPLAGPDRAVCILGESWLFEVSTSERQGALAERQLGSDYNALIAVVPRAWLGRALAAGPRGLPEPEARLLANPLLSVDVCTGQVTRTDDARLIAELTRHPPEAARLQRVLPLTLTPLERVAHYWALRHARLDTAAAAAGVSVATMAAAAARLQAREVLRVEVVSDAVATLQRYNARLDLPPSPERDTLGALWRSAVSRFGQRPWLIDDRDGGALTYAEAEQVLAAIGSRLREAGVTPGDTVALAASASATAALVLWAVVLSGGICGVIDPSETRARQSAALTALAPAVLVTDQPGLSGRAPTTVWCGDTRCPDGAVALEDWLRDSDYEAELADDLSRGDDVAIILPTSGSTGEVKLVALPHRALARSARSFAAHFGWTERDVHLSASALHAVSGLRNPLLATVAAGASAVLPAPQRRAPLAAPALIQRYDVTIYSAVPAALRQLVERADIALPGLRQVLCTGSSLLPAQRRGFELRFGLAPRTYYGLTETFGLCLAGETHKDGPGLGIGHPVDALVRVVDPAGRDAPPGTAGELLIHSGNLMSGYLGAPEQTAAVLRGGWLHTGDLVTLAQGMVSLVGRLRPFIKGPDATLVPLAAIEAALLEDPTIAEVALGVDIDSVGQERINAAVVPVGRGGADWLAGVRRRAAARLGPRRPLSAVFEVAATRENNEDGEKDHG